MKPDEILRLLELNQYNFVDLLSYIFVYFAILWLLFSIWVLKDITSRTKNFLVIIGSFLLVALFNLPGLLMYLLLRPEKTLEEDTALNLYQISQLDDSLLTCSDCKSIVKKNYKFCTVCGHDLYLTCDFCDRQIDPIWVNCAHCGKRIQPTTEERFHYFIARLQLKLRMMEINFGQRVQVILSFINGFFGFYRKLFTTRVKVKVKSDSEVAAAPSLPLVELDLVHTHKMDIDPEILDEKSKAAIDADSPANISTNA